MKQYLIELFRYNDWANRKLLEAINQIPDKEECVKLFSHLISAQEKWMNRITRKIDDTMLKWYEAPLPVDSLQQSWTESYQQWNELLQNSDDETLSKDIVFKRASDGKDMKVKLQDIILQLNYHSIHHRAQINKLISRQGFNPPATDYILTVIQEVL